jgi:transposase-like protein
MAGYSAAKKQPNPKTGKNAAGRAPRTSKRTYTPQEKIAAVTAMILANRDHPLSYASIAAARAQLGEDVHTSSLDDWHKQYSKDILATLPAISKEAVVQDTYDSVLAGYQAVVRKGLDRAQQDTVINDAKFDKLMLGIAIAQTKMNEMIGISPAIYALLQRIEQGCALNHIDLEQALTDIGDHLHSKAPRLADIARLGSDAAADGDSGQS